MSTTEATVYRAAGTGRATVAVHAGRTQPGRSVLLMVMWALAASACTSVAQGPASPAWMPSPEAIAVMDSIAREAVESGHVAGISLGVASGGRISHSVSQGVASLDTKVPATDSTVYRIGSIAKQMTAAAILRLEHEGRLSVADPLVRHLPDLPPQWAGVTIDHVLTHTSGIPSYTDVRAFWDRATEFLSVDDRLAFVTDAPLDFEPGSGWAYSNTGYLLLGPVIEQASGMSYARYLETMLRPLGLRETGACRDDAPRLARGYDRRGDTFSPAVSNQIGDSFADGDLCSSTRDLLKWSSALARGEVIPQASHGRMIQRARLSDGGEVHYGYGFDILALDGVGPIAEHGGAVPGFRGHLAYYPTRDVAIVVLTNTGEPIAQIAKHTIERRVFAPLLPAVVALELPAERAARYVGTFALYLTASGAGPFTVRVVESGGWLHAEIEGMEVPMLWQGGHDFVDGMDLGLGFRFDVVDGRASSLTMTRSGLEFVGSTVDAATR